MINCNPNKQSRTNKKPAEYLRRASIMWSRGESNPRPLECHSSALPTELRPHDFFGTASISPISSPVNCWFRGFCELALQILAHEDVRQAREIVSCWRHPKSGFSGASHLRNPLRFGHSPYPAAIPSCDGLSPLSG